MTDSTSPSAWRGRALLVVAALHCVFVLALGSIDLGDPKLEPYTGKAPAWAGLHPGFGSDFPPPLWLLSLFWSLFFGLTLAVVGALVHSMERAAVPVPRAVSGTLLAIGIVGGVLAPASGFWFVIAIAVLLLRRP